ncbi:hypothetical protein KL937_001716 [Ogataea polymorpha]|uniref:uncharacterized protein n=1 Tax=Ogataea polymorpha TaxID=460523 RepID=UPI0007F4CB6A|nr:uncharacterized protein OGAPODRAFT_95363 [Ogataea polymorpha]KAG7880869.1 hypothetical protein KL937_001716 [Ogataea polymorpha]KAG7936435.1 hypothetical protein KL934_001902 [Ogataea polymorpha]KAG7936666.1 hypothetical protein KL904_002234 [Ogataea polymorpha]OBA14297.1 hypothetical protein OGAPODRAFT_95363 [Ogataea polymorpha]
MTDKIDKHSLEYVVRSGIAGGVAGISAKTLIAPLDRVKILFQTNNPHYRHLAGSFRGMFKAIQLIYHNDGFMGLYQGHSATLLRIFPYAAIKFVCYEQIRTFLIPRDEYETAGRRLLAGSFAGVLSVAFTYPLDLVRVRLAFETSHSRIQHGRGKIWHILKTIYYEHPRYSFTTGGYMANKPPLLRLLHRIVDRNVHVFQAMTNFYRGFVPTIIGMVPYAGVSFYSHDMIHDLFRLPHIAPYTVIDDDATLETTKVRSESSFDTRKPLKIWAQLLAGGGAGMLAQAAAYPFEVIRRRMQVGGVANLGGQFFSIGHTIVMIYAERGFKGFYVGLGIGFLKIVPMFACSFYVYERCKHYLRI